MFSGLTLTETEIYRRLILPWERGFLNGSEGSEPSRMLRYGGALVSVALATWVRLLLDPVFGNQLRYPILLFAVLVTAWYGGVWPALLAVVIGGAADYFLGRPRGSFGLAGAETSIELVFYLAVVVGIAVLGEAMQAKSLHAIRKLQTA